MSKMPNDFIKEPKVGGTPEGVNNKVGSQGTEPTSSMPGMAAVSMASKNTPEVNEKAYSCMANKVGGYPMGK